MAQIAYRLTVAGEAAPAELVDVLQRVEVEEHADMASLMRLSFAVAVTGDGAGWSVVDDGLFPRLGPVGLGIEVDGAGAEPVFAGYVIETRAVLADAPRASTFDVVAMDATVLMNLEEKVRPWPNMSDADIAEAIFGEYGLTAVVDASQPTRQEDDVVPMQRGTDVQFLRRLAERNGFDVFVTASARGVEGHFHAPRVDEAAQGVLTVGLGGATNVPELSVTVDALRPTRARASQIAVDAHEPQDALSEAGSLTQLGATSLLASSDARMSILSGTGVVDAGELEGFTRSVVDRSSWAVRAEGDLDTSRYAGVLRAKRPVLVRGVGTLSGTYYVERVLHAFTAEGYTQRFTLRRNALGLSGSEDFSASGALAS